ncbi:MAG: PP2C family protein-serine/threonine phosphatase [Ignavibacteriaceae bacterium]
MIDKIKQLIIPLLIFFISLFAIHFFIPDYHPFGGIKISKNEDYILKESEKFLNNADIKFDIDKFKLEFVSDEYFVKWINSEYPLNRANQVLKKSGIAYYWALSQSGKSDSALVISSNSDENMTNKNEILKVNIREDGKIFGFARKINDSLITKSLDSEEAKNIVINFIHLFRNDIQLLNDSTHIQSLNSNTIFVYKETESFQKSDRNDYKIKWVNKGFNGYDLLLNAMIIGDQVESFNIQPVVPEEFKSKNIDIFEVVKEILFLLIIIISVIVFGFKKFRAYEIGFKQAIIFGIIILISFVLRQVLTRYTTAEANLLIGLVLGGIFIGGAAIILWAVSETVFREIWNEKFLSFDLIFYKKFTHSIVWKAIVDGISFGFGLTVLFLVLLKLVGEYINVSFIGDSFISQSFITAYAPPINILFDVINAYALLAVSFFMFTTAAIKRFITNDNVFIIISGLVWTLLIQSNVNPLAASLPINLIIGIILSIILIKFDLLITIISYLLFQFFIKASEFTFIQEPVLNQKWYIIIGLCLTGIIVGIVLILKKDKFTDYNSVTPKFVENVTERQRLSRELEVARHVQMSFLPKENPKVKGLDIASTCIPAFEVGGDYYDFIILDEKKIGIIIGDVSGKGTQAAFYMTLTKGFLKALAKQTDSPSEVLSKMNELFYENVERGRFISMIYAIVDLDKKIIRIARAGHNPVIYHDVSGKINLISPKGMALGLEKGPLFRKVISEYEENLETGKNFIFYTDGFTEAANKKDEEYGLDRLSQIAKDYSKSSAEEIMNKILEDVKKFIGKAPQHDDMTIVVLKIE